MYIGRWFVDFFRSVVLVGDSRRDAGEKRVPPSVSGTRGIANDGGYASSIIKIDNYLRV